MNTRVLLLSGIAALLLLGACEINKLNSAEDHYQNQRYASAIQQLDEYIQSGSNGALITKSEILRAKCYYELGLLAMQRENWDLAVKFLKLSSSEESDQALGSIYKILADKALEAGQQRLSLDYVNTILREIPKSELAAEMLFRRIVFMLDTFVDHETAWQDYMTLYDNYSNNPQEVAARKQIIRVVPKMVEYARQLYTAGYYSDGLRILFELGKYPVVDGAANNKMIGEAYIGQAESHLKGEEYLEADRFFRIAVQYDPSKKEDVNRRLEQVASLFITKGNTLTDQRDFVNALLHYQKVFDIIPEYAPANLAIERLNGIKANIARATEVYTQAEKAEADNRFGEALSLYRQAGNLDNRQEYRNKAAQMQNMIEAEANPTGFAQRIINEYKGGVLNTRIRKQKMDLLRTFDPSEIRDTGWKILISSGQYKYEARYDLITPTVSQYFVWQVNLRDRTIVPLNKLSETMMR